MRIVMTGAAGFLGFHLCEYLLARGDEVVGIDNLCTGSADNVAVLQRREGYSFLNRDVCEPFPVTGHVDAVMHLASPASPKDYLQMPIETLRAGSDGTRNALELAEQKGARFLLSSTSEVYGDPQVHPQPESYWGHVNPIGPRGVYDEAKRYAEAMTMVFHNKLGVDTRISRTFNTYGPRMRPDDGRVVSGFITQALRGEPLTVYGDGMQTRSFCYVDDQIRGIVALLDSDCTSPVNIGNPEELTVLELAHSVLQATGSSAEIRFESLPVDDPVHRKPDISLAERLLGWRAEIGLERGLELTVGWFRERLGRVEDLTVSSGQGS
jgi:dTDP-glucose 4,6-dehydratase